MIKTEHINGCEIRYAIFNPHRDDMRAAYEPGATVKGLAASADAGINFNFADTSTGVPIGALVVAGKQVVADIPKTSRRDCLYMLTDRSLHIGPLPRTPVQWAVQGSPPLLKGGKVVINDYIVRDNLGADIWQRKARRTAAGITTTGDLVVASTVDELSLEDMADAMLSLGCVDALNGDGGGSSYLWPADTGWGRKMGSAIVVKKGDAKVSTFKIALDAGHGPNTPGKRTPDGTMREFEFNSVVSQYAAELLAGYDGVEVGHVHATSGGTDAPLKERTDAANKWGANVFVSIHANAAGDGWSSAQGIETFVYTTRPDASVALANAVQRQLIKATGRPDRGVKAADFHVLRETKMPAILVECGFMTNREEAELLKSDAYRRKCAEAIVAGLGETYGLKRKEEPSVSGTFKDVPAKHWAKASIEKAAAAGVLAGVAPDTFGLGQPVTREQLAVILDRVGLLDKK